MIEVTTRLRAVSALPFACKGKNKGSENEKETERERVREGVGGCLKITM